MLKTDEKIVSGMPISQGIAIGPLFHFVYEDGEVTEREIGVSQVEEEITRYRSALDCCKADIRRLKDQFQGDDSLEPVAILDTHLQIMEDPLLTTEIDAMIRSSLKNADYVFQSFMHQYQARFNEIEDSFFKERGKDLLDIARRILSYLKNTKRPSLSALELGTVVFSSELAAADVAEASRDNVAAFITDSGGGTSHAAIVSKAKGIPYVANVDYSLLEQAIGETVVVDGRTGELVLFPSNETIKKYEQHQRELSVLFQNLEKSSSLDAETMDGFQMSLSANIEVATELDMLHRYGASGVGLFRSEYLFLTKQNFPSEEEQFITYRTMVEKMNGLPIIIRTFDVGGDKLTPEQRAKHKGNPYLGCRAIRFLLKERDIFRKQLKAILHAGEYGDVKVMFPMVSGLPELLEAKKVMSEARAELAAEGIICEKELPIGCMIEIPTAALIADILAKECDFLSIGTNDLTQYSLAVDRGNQVVNLLYSPMHPGIIRLIKLVVTLASKYDVPVKVCGEVAGDPRFTALLIGLGIQELSVSLRNLPWIKKIIRNTSVTEAHALAQKVLQANTTSEIQDLLDNALRRAIPEDFLHLSPFDYLHQVATTEEWEC